MATRQQLRGDGSKEYQIITNLSRGINNAVADDVLVDNAFRDVVNFSSDQLGNISKRDNLLGSNFKEFIRRIAYCDFDENSFQIVDYVGDTGDAGDYKYGYKRYSYGKVDQTILKNFYDLTFTNRGYSGNSADSAPFGVVKSEDGSYKKVPSYSGMNKEYETVRDVQIDAPASKDDGGSSATTYFVKEHIITTKEAAPFIAELYYTLDDNETKVDIVNTSVPDGWTLNEDGTVISKTYEEPSYEDVTVQLKMPDESVISRSTSICVNEYKTPLINTGAWGAYQSYAEIEETDDTYTLEAYVHSWNVGYSDMLGVLGDAGWQLVTENPISDESRQGVICKKVFYKDDITETFSKTLTFITEQGQYFSWNIVLSPKPSEDDKIKVKTIQFSISNCRLQHVQILEQSNFFKQLQDLDKLFRTGNSSESTMMPEPIKFDAYFMLYGNCAYTVDNREDYGGNTNCLVIYRLTIEISVNYELTVTINSKTVGDNAYFPVDFEGTYTQNTKIPDGFMANLSDEDLNKGLFINRFSNYFYVTTGKSSIIQLAIIEDDVRKQIKLIGSHNEISVKEGATNHIDLLRSNIYAPVPYEVGNPGFNLLSDNPITYIDSTGNVDKIRGVYYSVTEGSSKEPVQNVPSNIPFNIHAITTGDSPTTNPKIRPNNGELDEEKNPYTTLDGRWTSDTSTGLKWFECTGIDESQSYEMLIEKGEDKFLTYFTPTPYVPKDTGRVSDLSNIIYGCPRSKIINNQLVLFGKGGYLFFSDFDNFKYFPNYYYIYVVNGTDEEIVDVVYFRQFYAIFTNKRILRMSGDFGTDNFEVGPLNDFMGCVNHNTIKQVYNSLYFVGYNGIYALNQGYLGSGTENLKRIDTQLANTFNFDNVDYCYVMGSTYIIIMKDGRTWFTYDTDNDMFLRHYYNLGDNVTIAGISFIETLEENQIYAILGTKKVGNSFVDDLVLYNFPLAKDVNYSYKDSDEGYISSFETPYINLGTPTNTKKFKNLFIKMYNETDSLIPLYVTVYVDDILAITPEDYTIELDEETNTYYYYFKVDNNAELLKAHNLLGELTLGKDTLGDNIIQQLKLKINAKGRAIKIILADGYDYPNKDNSAIIKYRNNKKFSISTIGIVYKLKKVKEG